MTPTYTQTQPSAEDAAGSASAPRWRVLHVLLALLLLGSGLATSVMCLTVGSDLLWAVERRTPSGSLRLGLTTKLNETSNGTTSHETRAQYEGAPSLQVLLLQERNPRSLRCVAWRATADCRPEGPRQPKEDRECSEVVATGASGYCEVEDVASGESFCVMRRYCDSVGTHTRFHCADAPVFARSQLQLRQETAAVLKRRQPLPNVDGSASEQRDGIVMVADLKRVAHTSATITILREMLNCSLPIELWIGEETVEDATAVATLRAVVSRVSQVSLREINKSDSLASGANIGAIYNSRFERVLLLDRATVLIKDPSFLFESQEFEATGAVFWSSGRPSNFLESTSESHSLLWQLLDVSMTEKGQRMSDQLLVDRQRHSSALKLAYVYKFKWPSGLEKLQLVPTDGELFRLAWIKTNSPFYLVQAPPVLVGTLADQRFCGTAVVQQDTQGNGLFLNRIHSQSTGSVESPMDASQSGPLVWSHLLGRWPDPETSRNSGKSLQEPWPPLNDDMCLTQRELLQRPEFAVQEIDHSSYSEMGAALKRFTLEAAGVLQPATRLNQLQTEEDVRAVSVKPFPSSSTRQRQLRCIGWRGTAQCNTDGPREPTTDLECHQAVPNGRSGYCEVEDAKSGEHFRIMQRTCAKLKDKVVFRCDEAPGFANFRSKANFVMAEAMDPGFQLEHVSPVDSPSRDGIVMVVYPKLVPSAYATIRTMRELQGCLLPVEIWFRPDEVESSPGALAPLQELAQNASMGNISFCEIRDKAAHKFAAKVFAIYHSSFDRVLFLDADNAPVRDPSFLFDSREFQDTGALFWPDFWHPTRTMFGIDANSLVWELLDTPFVDIFEQESGQLLVDRRRHAAALKLTLFYATPKRNYFTRLRLAYGDKDLFRFAWFKLDASFHMIRTPPAMAGLLTATGFCGLTMVEHDATGSVLFLHRNQVKLTGESAGNDTSNALDAFPDPSIWTHLLSFKPGQSREHYAIQPFRASLPFADNHKCYGRSDLAKSLHFALQEVDALSFSGLETALRQFAMRAADIRRQHEHSSTATEKRLE